LSDRWGGRATLPEGGKMIAFEEKKRKKDSQQKKIGRDSLPKEKKTEGPMPVRKYSRGKKGKFPSARGGSVLFRRPHRGLRGCRQGPSTVHVRKRGKKKKKKGRAIGKAMMCDNHREKRKKKGGRRKREIMVHCKKRAKKVE